MSSWVVPIVSLLFLVVVLLFVVTFYLIYRNRVFVIDNRDELKKLSVKVDQVVVDVSSALHELSSASDYNDMVLRDNQRSLEQMHHD